MLAHVSGSVDEQLLAQSQYLIEENRILGQQLTARPRLDDGQRISLAEKALAMPRAIMERTVSIGQPATILKWRRRLIAKKLDGSRRRSYPGRPRVSAEVEQFILRMARDNPRWGYDRIAGSLRNLGHQITDQSAANIPKRHGLPPSGQRTRGETWHAFMMNILTPRQWRMARPLRLEYPGTSTSIPSRWSRSTTYRTALKAQRTLQVAVSQQDVVQEYLPRRAAGNHFPVMHYDDAGTQVHSHVEVVGRDDLRVFKGSQHVDQAPPCPWVQAGGRLVHHQDIRR